MNKEEIKQEFLKTYNCQNLKQFKFKYLSYNKFEELMDEYFSKCSYIQKCEQENQQLKEQLQHKYDNFPKTVKNLSKEQLESLYLDLLHIENEEKRKLEEYRNCTNIVDETIEILKRGKSND